MIPWWFSTIFFTIASPMPVPKYCSLPWSLWNTSKIFSLYSFSKPMPLSVMLRWQYSLWSGRFWSFALSYVMWWLSMVMCGRISGFENLRALPMRFCMSWRNWKGIIFISQSAFTSIVAFFRVMISPNSSIAVSIIVVRSVFSNFHSEAPKREKVLEFQ